MSGVIRLLRTCSLKQDNAKTPDHLYLSLSFQVQSLSRSSDEQRLQFRGSHRTARISTGSVRRRASTRALPTGATEQDMPEHDLRPPQ